jgi:hypothetical protein
MADQETDGTVTQVTDCAIVGAQTGAVPTTASGEPIAARRAPLVFLRFRPTWTTSTGSEIRAHLLHDGARSPEAAERARIILQELLEIALRHRTALPEAELELELVLGDGRVEVAVTQRADPALKLELEGAVARVNASVPEAAYIDALLSPRFGREAGAYLGLARLRLEGKAELTLGVLHDGRIRLQAREQP